MMDFAEAAGFFPAAFGQTPVVTTSTRPKGDLGPKYSIEYAVPNGGVKPDRSTRISIRTRKPGAWTYMPAGQPIFDMKTHGGWFTDPRAEGDFVARGLPKSPPGATSTSAALRRILSTGKIGAVLLVLFGIGAAAVLTRRHLRRTATT